MKSPFASLNWGVTPPKGGAFLVTSSYSGYGDYDFWIGSSSDTPQVYMNLADAIESLFQDCVQGMESRAESYFDMGSPMEDGEEMAKIWEIYDRWNAASGFQLIIAWPEPSPRRQIAEVWDELSSPNSGTVTWEDYAAFTRKQLNPSQRERLDNVQNDSEFLSLDSVTVRRLVTCNLIYSDDDEPYAYGLHLNLYVLPNSVSEDST